jgi:hypothetical protein
VTPKDPNVSGWAPDFLPGDAQFEAHADRLRSLVGDTVLDVWVVWNLEHDQWFADLPVVVQLRSGRQLEVCWEKSDDLSITWDTIDVAATPKAWVEWPLTWRSQPLPALAPVIGLPLEEVAATSFRLTTRNVDHPHDADSVWLNLWITNGLWLGARSAGLHIHNAGDENGVESTPPSRDAGHDRRAV